MPMKSSITWKNSNKYSNWNKLSKVWNVFFVCIHLIKSVLTQIEMGENNASYYSISNGPNFAIIKKCVFLMKF